MPGTPALVSQGSVIDVTEMFSHSNFMATNELQARDCVIGKKVTIWVYIALQAINALSIEE